MSVVIENVTNRPVLLRLNSGKTLHLAASITSTEILEVEVNNNSKVKKLLERKIINLHPVEKKSTAGTKRKKSKAKTMKKTMAKKETKAKTNKITIYS